MRINKKVLIIATGIIFCAGVFYTKLAFAGASVSLTAGGTWALGTKGASSETTSSANAWTVTNDSGDGTEDVNIKVSSTGSWTPSADDTPTTNEFLLKKDSSAGQIITSSDGSLVTSLANAGTNSFGLYFKAPPTGSEEGAHTLTVTLTATNWVFACGGNITVDHNTADGTSAATGSITYGTVTSSLSGASKCWITRNLGATTQASSATDNTAASAGWFWQFDAKQGYTTTSTWTSDAFGTDSSWVQAKDPCYLLLGTGWRLPTNTEWSNFDANVTPNSDSGAWSSALKIHSAGSRDTGGTWGSGGSIGFYWSGTLNTGNSRGYYMTMDSGYISATGDMYRGWGYTVRCIKD